MKTMTFSELARSLIHARAVVPEGAAARIDQGGIIRARWRIQEAGTPGPPLPMSTP